MQLLSVVIPLITTALGVFILTIWPPNRTRSFSENIARRRSSLLLFAVVFVPITCVYYFYLWWLGDQMTAPWVFQLVLVVSFVGQLILTLVPVRSNSIKDVHTNASFTVVGAMLLLPLILSTLSDGLSDIAFWLPIAYLFVNGGLFILYLLRNRLRFVRANFLFFQMSFFVVFWLFIILETYLVLG